MMADQNPRTEQEQGRRFPMSIVFLHGPTNQLIIGFHIIDLNGNVRTFKTLNVGPGEYCHYVFPESFQLVGFV